MEWTRTGIFITLLVVVCACTQKNKTVTDAEPDRPEAFANDDELLDYIQKTHFNYMWEGAEKTSGLACERIHLDNVYPQQDQDGGYLTKLYQPGRRCSPVDKDCRLSGKSRSFSWSVAALAPWSYGQSETVRNKR